jgi:hypothetical protein
MKRETTAEGATIEDALDAALAELGVQQGRSRVRGSGGGGR